MKAFLLFVILLSTAFGSFAQTVTKSQLSIGGEYGLPVGPVTATQGTVLGASIKYELPVSSAPVFITLTAGFSDYLSKLDYNGPLQKVSGAAFVPIEAGAKYYFSKLIYAEGDAGVSFGVDQTDTKTAFIFAPIIGVSAPTNKHKATIDLGLRYEARTESGGPVSQIGLRVAYRFGI